MPCIAIVSYQHILSKLSFIENTHILEKPRTSAKMHMQGSNTRQHATRACYHTQVLFTKPSMQRDLAFMDHDQFDCEGTWMLAEAR